MPHLELIHECVHCGFCLPACPTYQSWGQEMDSPRGRIYLMKAHVEGRVPLSAEVVQHFDRCLGCLACVSACPSGVKYDVLLEQMRAEIEPAFTRPPGDRRYREVLFGVLPYRRRLWWLALLLWLYQRSGLASALRRLGAFRLLPSRLSDLDELAPRVTWRSLWARLPRVTQVPAPRRRVALLQGCVQGVFFPEVNAATVRVLAAEGCEVVVSPELGCCGALSLHAGRKAEAQAHARRAILELERLEIDTIAVNAAGCGSTMKHWSRLLEDDDAWRARAERLQAKVRDVSELVSELGARAQRHPLALRVAYHDACHLSHGQGLRAEPRALLRSIPELELIELPSPDQCCGSAGVYNLLEPNPAREIGARKAGGIAALAADVIASGNPGCTLQIQRHLGGSSLRALHPIELLDAAIRGAPPRVRTAPRGRARAARSPRSPPPSPADP